jgi:hypothetical protein
LRENVGRQGADIIVGARCDARPGESNGFEFLCLMPQQADPSDVRAVAGGVVSEAPERYKVLTS